MPPYSLAPALGALAIACSLLATNASGAEGAVATAEPPAAVTAVPQDADWWRDRHRDKLATKDRMLAEPSGVRLVFVGDSITQSWESDSAKGLWAERFVPRRVLNLGFSGDRTQHVLWRLAPGEPADQGTTKGGELDGLSPALYVVMIGTNNTGHLQDPAEDTAEGVRLIVERLREASPEAHVLLLAVFPRGATTDDPLRKLNDGVNERIAKLADNDSVHFLDIAAKFLNDDGTLSKEIMPDLLHLSERGYGLWADAIEPHVARLMGE
ncbi:MAG: GDSL-type esterase/lipase family protein [Lacipirellulaceae bacterium]